MSKKKRKSKTISDLYLDRPTSHGGWPGGHSGSYTDNKTPVNKQLAKFFQEMGLIDDDNPRARISEGIKVKLSEDHLKRYLMVHEGMKPLTAMTKSVKETPIASPPKNGEIQSSNSFWDDLAKIFKIHHSVVNYFRPVSSGVPGQSQSGATHSSANYYDLRTSVSNSDSAKLFNSLPYSEDPGRLGEEIVGHYARGYEHYKNMNNSHSSDIPIAGRSPRSFPGVDLWLSKDDLDFTKYDVDDKGVLDFSKAGGVFASVKTSSFGAKSGMSNAQQTALDTGSQYKACISILCVWMLKRQILDNSNLSVLRGQLEDNQDKAIQGVQNLMKNHSIKEVIFPLGAYNLSGISPDEIDSVFYDNDLASSIGVISKMRRTKRTIAKLNLENFTPTNKLRGSSYPDKESVILGDPLDPSVDIKNYLSGIDLSLSSDDYGIKGKVYSAQRRTKTVQGVVKSLPSEFKLSYPSFIPKRPDKSGANKPVMTKEEIDELFIKAFDLINDLQREIANSIQSGDFKDMTGSSTSLEKYAKTSVQAFASYAYMLKIFTGLANNSGQFDPDIDYEINDNTNIIFDGLDFNALQSLDDCLVEILAIAHKHSQIISELNIDPKNPYVFSKQESGEFTDLLKGNFGENLKEYCKVRSIRNSINFDNETIHLNDLQFFFEYVKEITDIIKKYLDSRRINYSDVSINTNDLLKLAQSTKPTSDTQLRGNTSPEIDDTNIIYHFFTTVIDTLKLKPESKMTQIFKKEIQLALICFRFFEPKPPGLKGSQFTDLLGFLNEKNNYLDQESKFESSFKTIVNRLNLISSIIHGEDEVNLEQDTFGNEKATYANLNINDPDIDPYEKYGALSKIIGVEADERELELNLSENTVYKEIIKRITNKIFKNRLRK